MMNQIKILIAEDEPAILRGICAAISMISDDFIISGTAYDGENALKLIQEHHPHIVITDIKMPLMDGLTLIEEAKKRNSTANFVILTGFAEFEYAKKTITLGVSDYLLKPVDPEELGKLLNGMKQEINSKSTQIQKEYIRSCFFKKPLTEYTFNPLANCSLHLLFSYYGSIVNNTYSEFNLSGEIVRNLDTSFLNGIYETYHLPVYSFRGNYYNEFVYAIVSPADKKTDIFPVVDEIRQNAQQSDTYVNFVLSAVVHSGEEIRHLMQNAYLFTLFHLPFGKNTFLIQDDTFTAKDAIEISGQIAALAAKFRPGITENELKHILSDMTAWWRESDTTQFQLLADVRHIASAAIHVSPNASQLLFDPTEVIASSDSYDELLENLLHELTKILFPEHMQQKKSSSQLVDDIRAYLDKNFTQQITYKVFYDIWGYNEKYITTLFKEAFGISPSKYITSLRLEMAKNIMKKNPQILLKDVAEQTGYTDALYFSRVFKNNEGMSPSAFIQSLA
ncbi:MAG: response regulator [Clostridiales bacterium]|nr:response regulator [Clostridiales bacterium]MDU3241795.1 response regulator [Clostridiales bacterium]